MPMRSKRYCSWPGCGEVVDKATRCEVHQQAAADRETARKAALDAQRQSSTVRGYDSAWRAVQRQFIQANPTCAGFGDMEGKCGQPATDVDHVVSVADAPDLRLRWSNLRPYCHPCHSARTASDQGFGKARATARGVP